MTKFNPFKPGSIVHPGMFAGRRDELDILDKALYQTAHGNPSHFLIHGERGIGKSSLLMLTNAVATGNIESINDNRYNLITINIELEPNDEYGDIITKIARELSRVIDKNEALKRNLKKIWEFITNWEVLGVKYKRGNTPVEAMLEELSEKIIAVAEELNKNNSGIFIFIDEADKPPSQAGLGEFVKVFTERLSKGGANNVGLGIIGISNVIEKMKESHESSVRIFNPIHLKPLIEKDRKMVIKRGLEEAEKVNKFTHTITDDALKLISDLSEGYPYFIQQYAYSAFDQDTDNNIDESDVQTALIKENGALQLLGQRYFENMYTDDIRSDDYRKVLQVIAQHMPDNTTRKQIIMESGLKEHTINNALTALTKRGSVVAVSGQVGMVRLPSQSFAVWIRSFKIVQ